MQTLSRRTRSGMRSMSLGWVVGLYLSAWTASPCHLGAQQQGAYEEGLFELFVQRIRVVLALEHDPHVDAVVPHGR